MPSSRLRCPGGIRLAKLLAVVGTPVVVASGDGPALAAEPAQSIVSEDETGIIVEVSERSFLVDTASGIVFDRLALEHMAESDVAPRPELSLKSTAHLVLQQWPSDCLA